MCQPRCSGTNCTGSLTRTIRAEKALVVFDFFQSSRSGACWQIMVHQAVTTNAASAMTNSNSTWLRPAFCFLALIRLLKRFSCCTDLVMPRRAGVVDCKLSLALLDLHLLLYCVTTHRAYRLLFSVTCFLPILRCCARITILACEKRTALPSCTKVLTLTVTPNCALQLTDCSVCWVRSTYTPLALCA